MRIKTIHVHRYGPLTDVRRELPKAGVVVLHGPNEVGKSSLLEMIRGVLFGWPKGAGGIRAGWGGRLTVEAEDGQQATVERSVGGPFRAVAADGHELTVAEWQDHWLNGTGLNIFQNVYGFGLEELTRLESLADARLNDELAAVGLGVSVNLSDVRKTLEKRHNDLWLPKGVKPPLSKALARIDKLGQQIRRLEQEEGQYRQIVDRETALAEAVERWEREVGRRQQAVVEAHWLLELWPHWERLGAIDREMAALTRASAVPDEALTAVPAAEAAWQRLEVERQQRATELAAEESALPPPAHRKAAANPDWVRVLEAVPEALAAREAAQQARGQVEELRRGLVQDADALGVAVERLEQGLPLDVWQERVRTELDELRRLREAVHSREEMALRLDSRIGPLKQELERLDVPTLAEWQRRVDELEQIRDLAFRPASSGWWALLVGLVGLAAGMTGQSTVSRALGVAAVVLAAAVAVQGFRAARRARVEALRALDVPNPAEWAAEWARLQGMETLVRDKDVRMRELRQAEQERAALRDEAARFRAQQDAVAKAGQAWRVAEGLPDMEGEAFSAWLERARSAQDRVVRWRRALEAVSTADQKVVEFLEAARAVAERIGVTVRDGGRLETWRALREEWLKWPEQEERWTTLKNRLAEYVAAQREQAEIIDGWAHHLACPDRDALATLLAEARRYRELAEERRRAISVLTAGSASWDRARERFQEIERIGPEAHLAALEEALHDAQQQRQAAMEEWTKTRQERESLERSGTLGEGRLQRESALREAEKLAERWAAHKLAVQVLNDAIRTYQQAHQPRVLTDASEWFRRITGGRYHRVFQGLEDQQLMVEHDDGVYAPAQLSRGTREQLYLTLRLAWIQERARRGSRLPLILDDILVNSDPTRQKALAELLVTFGQTFQILYLTCHPETVRLLGEMGELPVIDMAG